MNKYEYAIGTVKHEATTLSKLRVATNGLDEKCAQSKLLQHIGLNGIDNIHIYPTSEDAVIIERFDTYVSLAGHNQGTQHDYYRFYLDDPINCLWNLIKSDSCLSQRITITSGMKLLGLKPNSKNREVDTKIDTVLKLYHLLSGYCTFLSKTSTSRLSTTSTSKNNSFKRFNTDISTVRYIYSKNLDTAVGKELSAWIRSKVPNPNIINYSSYKREMFQVPPDPQPDASAVESGLRVMIGDGDKNEQFKDRQLCTTFKELVTVLQDVHQLRLNSDNHAEMTRDGWTTFLNSMLVSSMWFVTLKSKFHPSGGVRSIPLDVLAGITSAEDYECIETGPMLDLYLEKHPDKEHQHLCVTILQNHLSKSYVDSIRERWKDAKFYMKNQKYVRVATQEGVGSPFVGMEFGNDIRTYGVLQAEPANDVDDEAIKMANFIMSTQDEVFKNACDILQKTVLSFKKGTQATATNTKAKRGAKRPYSDTAQGDTKKDESSEDEEEEDDEDSWQCHRCDTSNASTRRCSSCMCWKGGRMKKIAEKEPLINYQALNRLSEPSKKRLNEKLKSCGPIHTRFSTGSDVFAYPISTNGIPLDCVDSVHTNVSPGSSYSMHSDTFNKEGNHDNDFYHSHALSMRIWTQGFQFSALSPTEGDEKAAGDVTAALPSNNVSLIHGIPDGSNGVRYCPLHGRFSIIPGNNVGAFTLPQKGERISMGHATHAHLQPTGSQGDLQHEIVNNKNTDLCRVITSARTFHPFTSRLSNKIRDKQECITSSSCQKFSNVIDHVLNSGRLKEVVTAEKLHLRRPTRTTNEKSTRFWQPNVMANGECVPTDEINRKDILGVKNSYEYKRVVALNWRLVLQLYHAGVTLLVTHREGYGRGAKKIASTCGPHITPSNIKGKYYLTQPWYHQIPDIYAIEGVPANKHVKHIIGEKRDVIIARSLSKSHSSLGVAIKTVISGEGELGEFIIRGSGGASFSAGNVAPSAIGMDTTDPTFVLATPQQYNSYDKIALEQSIREGRSFNLFYGDRLIGLCRVKEIRTKNLSREEFDEERKKFSAILEELHELAPTVFPNKTLTDQMKNELNSMMTCGNWYYMVPVLPTLHKRFSSEVENIPWKLIEMDAGEDFQVPRYACNKEDTQTLKHDHFTSVEDMLDFTKRIDNRRFYSKVGYEKIRMYLGDGEEDDTLKKVSESKPNSILRMLYQTRKSKKHKFTLDAAIGAAVHSGGLTTLKAASPELVKLLVDGGSELSTASKLLSGLTGIDHQNLNGHHNLKGVMAKPVHPAHLGLEMPIGICMLATGSLDKSLREVNKLNKQWKMRAGGTFFVSQDGFNIAFQVICIIITSTGNLLDALYAMDGNSFKPDESLAILPESKRLSAYLGFVEHHDWSSTLVHKNFRGAIKTKNDYISFIENLSKYGSQAFRLAMKDTSTTSRICNDRSKILNNFKTMFSSEMSTVFTEFQVHVIMRAIECCMHEPFGVVKEPVHGSGSREIARLLKRDFEGEKGMFNEQKMLESMNDRARKFVNKGDDNKGELMRDELLVLGLEWSMALDCLVHRSGIGKKFDVNDIEHLECMLYKLYFNTSPSMNVGITYKYGNEKFYPIKLKGRIAAEQKFMELLFPNKGDIINAYVRLLRNQTYEHRALGEIFRIDHNENETDIINVNDHKLDEYIAHLPTLNWQKGGQIRSSTM